MKSKDRVYTSVLKNIPLKLMDKIRQYHKHKGIYSVRWNMRKPIPDQKYGWGGSLKRENATAADMYVDMTEHHFAGKTIARQQQRINELEQIVGDLESFASAHEHDYNLLQQELFALESAHEVLQRVAKDMDRRRKDGERRYRTAF